MNSIERGVVYAVVHCKGAAINNSTTVLLLRSESLRTLGRFASKTPCRACLHVRTACRTPASPCGCLVAPPAASGLPCGDRFAGGQGVFGTRPCGPRLRAVLGLHLTVQQKHLARPRTGSGGGALPPSSFFAACRLRLRLRQKTRRLPHQAAAWTGAGAPTSPSLAACPLRSRLAAREGKAAPLMRRLGIHFQTYEPLWPVEGVALRRIFLIVYSSSRGIGRRGENDARPALFPLAAQRCGASTAPRPTRRRSSW